MVSILNELFGMLTENDTSIVFGSRVVVKNYKIKSNSINLKKYEWGDFNAKMFNLEGKYLLTVFRGTQHLGLCMQTRLT